ncbi:hypothetical protein PGT21_025206 [Puccinia graminis f. sp. tritici]|uniref:Uncharacterized protein n=1 Tax=Puccinia graminis f. sp. tritici TaxID=56615 RepID=A0A5B0NU56_PUCGR|nr:hypothetical protein PGT21_025206 [Puccinia graminis f. sp. tritici]KAA1092262.1 hypothetical protein PGTUg99_009710 [Puccinia graminis f. sp. tritici]
MTRIENQPQTITRHPSTKPPPKPSTNDRLSSQSTPPITPHPSSQSTLTTQNQTIPSSINNNSSSRPLPRGRIHTTMTHPFSSIEDSLGHPSLISQLVVQSNNLLKQSNPNRVTGPSLSELCPIHQSY